MASKIEWIFGTTAKAWKFVRDHWGAEIFDEVAERRREDLLVHFALAHFARRRPLAELPPQLRWDVKAYFGSLAKARESGKQLLFSIGNLESIRQACLKTAAGGIGRLNGEHSLFLHSSLVKELPPIVRCYVGCAAQIFGDLETADVVKIHLQSQKISLMMYQNFFENPLPRLNERIKIRLGDLDFDYFDYRQRNQTQVLYWKSHIMPDDHPTYEQQSAFDQALSTIPDIDLSGYGPSEESLSRMLREKGMNVSGFVLRQNAGFDVSEEPL